MNIDESKIFIKDADGDTFVDEDLALACLLSTGSLFLNNVKSSDSWTTAVYVLCNDLFAWGCADVEPISNNDGQEPSEIIDCYRMWKEDPKFGILKWCCVHRGYQPQKPIREIMEKAGAWCDRMEALKPNYYDDICRKTMQKKGEKVA